MTIEKKAGHGLLVEKDVPVTVSDGTILRANVFRPDSDGQFPVVMAKGAYGKDVHFRDAFAEQQRFELLHELRVVRGNVVCLSAVGFQVV